MLLYAFGNSFYACGGVQLQPNYGRNHQHQKLNWDRPSQNWKGLLQHGLESPFQMQNTIISRCSLEESVRYVQFNGVLCTKEWFVRKYEKYYERILKLQRHDSRQLLYNSGLRCFNGDIIRFASSWKDIWIVHGWETIFEIRGEKL